MTLPQQPESAPKRHKWWLWSPAYTLGVVSFVPAMHAAVKFRTRSTIQVASILFALNVLVWVMVGSGDEDGLVNSLGTMLSLALAVAGTWYAFSIHDKVFGTEPAPDPALTQALGNKERRKEAIGIASKDPSLARDLKIGRPDLPRSYDDGGLVDINNVPVEVFVSHLGFTADLAQRVVAERSRLGAFDSFRDLQLIDDVPQKRIDRIADRTVAL